MKSVALLCLAFAVANAHSIYRFQTTHKDLHTEKDQLFNTNKYYQHSSPNQFPFNYQTEEIERYFRNNKYETEYPSRRSQYTNDVFDELEQELRSQDFSDKMVDEVFHVLKSNVFKTIRQQFPEILEQVQNQLQKTQYPEQLVEKMIEVLQQVPTIQRQYPEMITKVEEYLHNKNFPTKMIVETIEILKNKLHQAIQQEFPNMINNVEEHLRQEEYPTHVVKKVIQTLEQNNQFNDNEQDLVQIIEDVEEYLQEKNFPTKMVYNVLQVLKTKVYQTIRREFSEIMDNVEQYLRNQYSDYIVKDLIQTLKYKLQSNKYEMDLEQIFEDVEEYLKNKDYPTKMVYDVVESLKTQFFQTVQQQFSQILEHVEEYLQQEQYPTHMIQKVIETLKEKFQYEQNEQDLAQIFDDVEEYLQEKNFPTKMVYNVLQVLKTKVYQTIRREFSEIMDNVEQYLRNQYSDYIVKDLIQTLKYKLQSNKYEMDLEQIFEDVEEYLKNKDYPTKMVYDVVESLKTQFFQAVQEQFSQILEDVEEYLQQEQYPTHMIQKVIEFLKYKVQYSNEQQDEEIYQILKKEQYNRESRHLQQYSPNPRFYNHFLNKNFYPFTTTSMEQRQPELKHLSNQLDEIQETVENVEDKINKVYYNNQNEQTTLDYEEALQAVRSEKASERDARKYGLDNMKVQYIDDLIHVQLMTPNGKAIEKPLPRGSSIITVLQHEDDLDDLKWFRIKNTLTTVYFHKGSPVKVHMIDESGRYTSKVLGDPTVFEEATFALPISDKHFFATEVMNKDDVSIVSYGNAPGWTKQNHVVVPFEKINGDYFKLSKSMIKSFDQDKHY